MVRKSLFLQILLLLFVSSSLKSQVLEKKYRNLIKESTSTIRAKKLSGKYFVLIDYSIFSGKKRMFIYNIPKKKFVDSFLVMHGNPRGKRTSTVRFSNEPKSFLSSKGRFIIDGKLTRSNNFIAKYNLKGLDVTNSNAYRRKIVIHYSTHIPLFESSKPIVNSRGCPAISWVSFIKMNSYIKGLTLLVVI